MTLTVSQSLSRWLREEFHPARLLPASTSGALIGALSAPCTLMPPASRDAWREACAGRRVFR